MGAETTNGDGFGVGWYGTGDGPGVYHSVAPAWGDANLRELAAHIASPLFLAHVRATSGTAVQETNCHPFRYGQWLFVFASADPASLRQLHPENTRLQLLRDGDRLVVSEPFADLPGARHDEVPEDSAVVVEHGGELEHRPFRPTGRAGRLRGRGDRPVTGRLCDGP